MDNLYLKAILSGLVFGAWPLLMNKSGLRGNTASAIFCLVALLIIMPFALNNLDGILKSNWKMAIGAGLCGGIGLLFFNSLLANATSDRVGTLFIVMLAVQMAVPAMFQVIQDGGLNFYKGLGFTTAIATLLLLSKT